MSMSDTTVVAGVQLKVLGGVFTHAEQCATTALRVGEPGPQPSEALRQFSAADAEVVAVRRRTRKLSIAERAPPR